MGEDYMKPFIPLMDFSTVHVKKHTSHVIIIKMY